MQITDMEKKSLQKVFSASKKRGVKTIAQACKKARFSREKFFLLIRKAKENEGPSWILLAYEKMMMQLSTGHNNWCDYCGVSFQLKKGIKLEEVVEGRVKKLCWNFCKESCKKKWLEGLPDALPEPEEVVWGPHYYNEGESPSPSSFPWVGMCGNTEGLGVKMFESAKVPLSFGDCAPVKEERNSESSTVEQEDQLEETDAF